MNRSVTEGIIRGFTHGLLTATSLLANAPHAARALEDWRRLEAQREAGGLPSARVRAKLAEPLGPFELGIHLNLTQGWPLTSSYPPQLLDQSGCFCGIGRLFRHLHRRRAALEEAVLSELGTQIEFLFDRGYRPTHLNGHQYIEMLPGLRGTLRTLLTSYGINTLRVARERRLSRTTLFNSLQGPRPTNWALAHVKWFYAARLLRETRRWDVGCPDAFFGTSHAGRVDLPLVGRFLASAGNDELIEIGLHPASQCASSDDKPAAWDDPLAPCVRRSASEVRRHDKPAAWDDPLARHRPHELAMLTSPDLVDLLHSRGLSLGRLAGSAQRAARRAA